MGLPWDPDKIASNLTTLASLGNGDKFSVLKNGAAPSDPNFANLGRGGRGLRDYFARQRGGFARRAKQSSERRKKGESIMNDRQYLIPLTKLFERAILQYHDGAISGTAISAAYLGLQTMARGYARNRRRNAKMLAILQAVRAFVPAHSVPRCHVFRADEVFDLQWNDDFDVDDDFDDWLVATGNSNLIEEHEANVLDQIYGNSLPSTATATKVPAMPGVPYKRRKTGVCKQFWVDHNRNPAKLNGTVLTTDHVPAIRKLVAALDGDEGMLFAVSQVVNQAGPESMIAGILTHTTPANRSAQKHLWPFATTVARFMPTAYPEHDYEITALADSPVEIECNVRTHPDDAFSFMSCPLAQDPANRASTLTPTSGSALGIDRLDAYVRIRLVRAGTQVSWELRDAEITFELDDYETV